VGVIGHASSGRLHLQVSLKGCFSAFKASLFALPLFVRQGPLFTRIASLGTQIYRAKPTASWIHFLASPLIVSPSPPQPSRPAPVFGASTRAGNQRGGGLVESETPVPRKAVADLHQSGTSSGDSPSLPLRSPGSSTEGRTPVIWLSLRWIRRELSSLRVSGTRCLSPRQLSRRLKLDIFSAPQGVTLRLGGQMPQGRRVVSKVQSMLARGIYGDGPGKRQIRSPEHGLPGAGGPRRGH